MNELLKVPGIDINVQEKRGRTPLYLAEILLKANADPIITTFPDNNGKCTSAIDDALTDELKSYLREYAPKNRA